MITDDPRGLAATAQLQRNRDKEACYQILTTANMFARTAADCIVVPRVSLALARAPRFHLADFGPCVTLTR